MFSRSLVYIWLLLHVARCLQWVIGAAAGLQVWHLLFQSYGVVSVEFGFVLLKAHLYRKICHLDF